MLQTVTGQLQHLYPYHDLPYGLWSGYPDPLPPHESPDPTVQAYWKYLEYGLS